MQRNVCDEQPQAGVSPTSGPALCVEQVWVSLGAPSPAPTPSLPPVRPRAVRGPPHFSFLLILPPCLSQLLILSALLAPSLFSLCVQNSTKSPHSSPGCDPNSKECLCAGRLPFLCMNIAHTHSHTAFLVPPRAPGQGSPAKVKASGPFWSRQEKKKGK